MLVSLNVKNLALIDAADVEFTEGLNILSGETGAGKSIIIGSVTLALGAKAETELIRKGAEYALIELTFQSQDQAVISRMQEMDLPVEEDGTILISRRIQPARSIFKINGETVTARQIRSLSELLLDIHGQHEHQSLLHKEKHQEILDAYAGAQLTQVLTSLKQDYQELRSLQKEYQESSQDASARARELELASFEVEEIDAASLKDGEDDILEKKYQRMVNSRKIAEAVGEAARLTQEEEEPSVEGQIDRALRELRSVAEYDEKLQDIEAQLEEIDSLLGDFTREIASYTESLEYDEEEFQQTEERLNLLNHLKAKYGRTIAEILAYREKREETKDKLEHFEAYQEELLKKTEKAKECVLQKCAEASKIRKKAAAELSAKLKQALVDLNFLHVEFEIEVRASQERLGSDGYDDIEFMISTNPGEPIRPLHMIASGGELSRIMLALKTVLADKDAIETLIFDEIDTGISGKTAWKVSEKLGTLSKGHQVICITHLPQIAAMADTHFYIEKSTDGSSTVTSITQLSEQERVGELARMLGGNESSRAAIENAKELITTARQTKAG